MSTTALAVLAHGLEISAPGELAAGRANPFLALHLDHQAQRVLDHAFLGANTRQTQRFGHQFFVYDDIGTHAKSHFQVCSGY